MVMTNFQTRIYSAMQNVVQEKDKKGWDPWRSGYGRTPKIKWSWVSIPADYKMDHFCINLALNCNVWKYLKLKKYNSKSGQFETRFYSAVQE